MNLSFVADNETGWPASILVFLALWILPHANRPIIDRDCFSRMPPQKALGFLKGVAHWLPAQDNGQLGLD